MRYKNTIFLWSSNDTQMVVTNRQLLSVAFWVVFLVIGFLGSGCQCGVIVDPPMESAEIRTSLEKTGTGRPFLQFEHFIPGKTFQKSFQIFASGRSEIVINSFKVKGADADVFQIKFPKLPLRLQPGVKHTVEVSARSDKPGEIEADLVLFSVDAENVQADGSFPIRLRTSGTGAIPVFDCKNKLDFGAVDHDKSKFLECHLSNKGNQAFTIQKVEYHSIKGRGRAFIWHRPSLPLIVGAGEDKVVIGIQFSPAQGKGDTFAGAFTLITDLKGETPASRHRIHVSGKRKSEPLQVIPANIPCTTHAICKELHSELFCLELPGAGRRCSAAPEKTPLAKFPYAGPGGTSTMQVRLQMKSGSITVTKLAFGAENQHFRWIQKPILPLIVKGGEPKELQIGYFGPLNTLSKSTLSIATRSSPNLRVALSLENTVNGCALQVSPSKIAFTWPSTEKLLISNVGNRDCILERVVILQNDKNFDLFPAPGPNQVLKPNGQLPIFVKFKPASKIQTQARILIQSNFTSRPSIWIPLTGVLKCDCFCELKVLPDEGKFDTTPTGMSSEKGIRVTNVGKGDCVLSDFKLSQQSPAGSSVFTFVQKPTLPNRIPASDSFVIPLRFTPVKEGANTGTLHITSNAKVQPNFSVKLSGMGGKQCLFVSSKELDFGMINTTCSATTRELYVYHTGAKGCPARIGLTSATCDAGGCSGKTPIALLSVPTFPYHLTAYKKASFKITYKPKTFGAFKQKLTIKTDSSAQPLLRVALKGEGVTINKQRDVFQPKKLPVDILFMMDSSASMVADQQRLAKAFQAFVQWGVRSGYDFHVGVVTADVSGINYPAGCLRGKPSFTTSKSPHLLSEFSKNIQVGGNGHASEKGLESSFRALSWPAVGGCNKGFLRRKASLAIIYVSDEADQSPGDLNFYENYFKNLKANISQSRVTVHAIVGPPRGGCQGKRGNAQGAPRYWDLVSRLPGVRQSICDEYWNSKMSNIGSHIFRDNRRFRLSRVPDVTTITVRIGGKTIPQKQTWHYNASQQAVYFSGSFVPPVNSVVSVEYNTVCAP